MPKRMKTGIPGLDRILDGGSLYHNCILLKGPPGSGKTTLGIQIIQSGITRFEENGIIVLFEQFPQQLFRDISSYQWNLKELEEERKLTILFPRAEEITGRELVCDSPLISRIHEAAFETEAKRILIDSISYFLNFFKTSMDSKELLLRFINSLKSIGLTPILTAEKNREGDIGFDEYLADTVLLLSSEGGRDKTFPRRLIDIRKTRGHHHVRGRHPYRIGSRGIEVFPHVLAEPYEDKIEQLGPLEKETTGIGGLDEILGGGLARGTSTILAGMPGTYKTTAGAQFLAAGMEKNQPGHLITFYENPGFLANVMRQKGIDLIPSIEAGSISIRHFVPKNFYMDELLWELEREIREKGIKRLVIDGINELERAIEDPAMYKDFVVAFVSILGKSGVTSLFTQKMDQFTANAPLTNVKYASLFDGIIYFGTIEIESAVHKVITVLKMRGGDYAGDLRELRCGDRGLYICDKFVGLKGILAGNPQGQYKKTVEEIFQPLYFVEEFIDVLAKSELKEEQRVQIVGNLHSEVSKLVDKLRDHFGVSNEEKNGENRPDRG